ncbi:ABC transporter permease [Burkholderia thailandensis]|uniref:ABC-2 type transporter family protein n=1 Tax=Burkholderia thailandensis TaxID=57975 RepID=A0AAW9CN21_BURTH|nr:ABC transporter permease [Burkholderia thailandensis]AHI66449.1 ABC-2 type transporter family protein [Burkholderia thailandensis H0587]AOJ53826.1 ABC transporter permease [Burkholderia thailandensis]AVR28040.1 ABC transporter permease [Burkholderia thailandensis]MCS3394236.1 ABC transporter permease [Burkholderia thailandensis]MCS6427324.1 ABC transporter permease [Burkholderia thailandensis]
MRIRRLIAIAYKETLQIWRDPRSLAVALLMPLMQMALLGYGVSLDIKHVPLCVHDEERSQLSRELIDRFVSSGWFAGVRTLGSEAALRSAVDRHACAAAVVVPVDFSRTVATRGAAAVQTIFDATDTNTTNIAIGYARGVLAQFGADLNARWQAAHGVPAQTVGAIDLEPRVWFNEGLDSRNFVIPGVVAVILALVGAQLTSLTIAREWERGTMEQLISTPVAPLELMLGKVIPYFAVGFVDAAFCLLATVYWFGVPFRGSVPALVATTALFTLVVLGIGYLMSVRIRSQLGASQIALLLTMLPTTMLSGYTFAIEQMPAPIRAMTFIVYARYYVTILRSVFLKGGPIANIAAPFAALALYAFVIGWLSVRALRKRID